MYVLLHKKNVSMNIALFSNQWKYLTKNECIQICIFITIFIRCHSSYSDGFSKHCFTSKIAIRNITERSKSNEVRPIS